MRDYIGLDGSARTYLAIQTALDDVNPGRVQEIIDDLTPSESRPPVLGDSRQVSRYAEVLANERARSVLRMYDDLAVASAVLEQGALTDRLVAQVRTLREILVDASRLEVDASTGAAADELFELARSVRAVIRDRVSGR